MAEAGFRFIGIPAGKWRRYFDWRNFVDIFITLGGLIVAMLVILFFWPDKVFIKGGYVGVPVGLAAWVLRRPIVLHESDSVIGVANNILVRLAYRICVSFPKDAYQVAQPLSQRLIYTGVPVNEVFYSKEVGDLDIKLMDDKPMILVMGGSQGARAINKVVKDALPQLLEAYQVVHLAGGWDYTALQRWAENAGARQYYLFDFLPNTKIATLMKKSSMIISRAGATAISEIAAVGKPAIFIPLPGAANNHQFYNAKYLADRDAAVLIEQAQITTELLVKQINQILKSDLGKRLSFNISSFGKREAAREIAELLTQ